MSDGSYRAARPRGIAAYHDQLRSRLGMSRDVRTTPTTRMMLPDNGHSPLARSAYNNIDYIHAIWTNIEPALQDDGIPESQPTLPPTVCRASQASTRENRQTRKR